MFNHLVEKVRSYDMEKENAFREARDYEGLELYVMEHLLGVGKTAAKSKPTEKPERRRSSAPRARRGW